MPIDRTRLDPSIAEMAAADAAYEAAQRAYAEAVRALAATPRDAAAQTRLRRAAATVTSTRARVDTARRALDAVRIATLAAVSTSDDLLGSIAGTQVLGLFPIGLEAKLDPGRRLRVRVWPDAISTSTHDPRLNEGELDAGRRYWRAEAAAVTEEERRANWRDFANALGVTRAAWTAQALTPLNRSALGPGVDPVFPSVPMDDEKAPFVPRAAVLPDRWIAVGFKDDAKVFEHLGSPIPIDLAVGFDTTPTETSALTNREGEPIQLPPRMRWMTDFSLAVQAGMAFEIPLAAGVDRLDVLLVFGVRLTQSPIESAATLGGLLSGHRFSRGLAFVPQGTPTNNSAAGGSGMPARAERVETAFNVERQARAFPDGLASNGAATARAFGLDRQLFASIPDAGAAPSIGVEPDGFEPEIARAMQSVTWQVTLGAALEDFIALDEGRANALRDYFREHVRAGGPVPAMRVGRQPYGVLPITALSGFIAAPSDGIDPRLLPLLRATRSWWAMLRQPDQFAGTPEEAMRYRGRSAQLFAETTRQEHISSGANRWESLARSLAVATRNLIRDTWRTAQILNTVEGEPQPVTRPTVNDTTAGDLAALAAALPPAIASAPLPTSVLGRLARHAALLEWSRFARSVCQAAVDPRSRATLREAAAQNGIDTYLAVLIRALTPSGPTGPVRPPIGPIGPTRPIIARASKAAGGRASAPRTDPDGPPGPPEPPEPDPPRPPPVPPGSPDVDASELQRIAALVGSLAQPLATCPGATRLASFRSALASLAQAPGPQLESALYGALDLCNHRVDAWFTSLAARRLASLRATAPQGIVIGGWGCLQDVRPADPQDPLQRAEYIHTPSLDQAAAAAVLRSGARRANASGSQHADIDLSSRRVRLARWILEGIRNGRSLGELLGVRIERTLKGTAGEAQLDALRAQFHKGRTIGVLDGLALQENGLATHSDPVVRAAAQEIDDALDAVADALTAESVFQLVRGNPAGALIGLEAIANGEQPPPLRVTETPAASIRLTHRLIAMVPAGATAPGWAASATPRGAADPLLDVWCGCVLGPAANITLNVDGENGTAVPVSLGALNIAAIDVVLAGRGRSGELAELAVIAAQRLNAALRNPVVRADRAWKDLAGLCGAIAQTIARAEPLRAEALDVPSALPTAPDEDFGDLAARASNAAAGLAAVRDALVLRAEPLAAVRAAALFGVRAHGLPLAEAPGTHELDALLASVEARLATAAAASNARERLRALFGGDLLGLVPFVPRDPAVLTTATSPAPGALPGADALAVSAWLDATGRTRPGAARLASIQQQLEIARGIPSDALRVAQAPWVAGDRWIATAFAGKGGRPPEGRLSIVIHAPAGMAAGRPLAGLLIGAWSESVPSERRDTALALRYNSRSTHAPQAILLAVSPDPSKAWTSDTLVAALRETLDLARLRMLPPTTFSRAGHLPLVWLGQRPNGAGITFSL